jgi:hypothetical protein
VCAAAGRHLLALVPGAVLVGGTAAAALHAGHRRSLDGNHVLDDVRPRLEEVLATLEAAASWQTAGDQKLSADATLRRRILGTVRRVALPYPGFWLAALASLGEPIGWNVPVPRDDGLA